MTFSSRSLASASAMVKLKKMVMDVSHTNERSKTLQGTGYYYSNVNDVYVFAGEEHLQKAGLDVN